MSSTSSENSPEKEARKALAALDVQRKALELEAETITSELLAETPEGGPPMGIDTPLVDSDGYPRGDIDVYRARTLRGRLAVIQTDHKALMKQINDGLLTLAAFSKDEEKDKQEMAARKAKKAKPKMDPKTGKWVVPSWDGSVAGVPGGENRSFSDLEATDSTPSTSTNTATTAVQSLSLQDATTPFAKVNAVAADSPAEQAGLKEGDLVVEFGTVNSTNHRNLMAISELVPLAAAEQRGIPIKVMRPAPNETEHSTKRSLTLTPRPWAGRGLLGCHLVKYPQTS